MVTVTVTWLAGEFGAVTFDPKCCIGKLRPKIATLTGIPQTQLQLLANDGNDGCRMVRGLGNWDFLGDTRSVTAIQPTKYHVARASMEHAGSMVWSRVQAKAGALGGRDSANAEHDR